MNLNVELQNSMFLNRPGKIISYIETNYMDYAYDDILKFLEALAINVVSENIEEAVESEWSEDCKQCYKTLVTYYESEKRIYEHNKLKKGQGTKRSLRKMARKR